MNKSLKYIQDNITKLKDDLQHYTMVEKDSALASQIKYDLENLTDIEEDLKTLETIKENLKYGYVFIGYDKDNKPLFRFADTNLYKFIELNK